MTCFLCHLLKGQVSDKLCPINFFLVKIGKSRGFMGQFGDLFDGRMQRHVAVTLIDDQERSVEIRACRGGIPLR